MNATAIDRFIETDHLEQTLRGERGAFLVETNSHGRFCIYRVDPSKVNEIKDTAHDWQQDHKAQSAGASG